MTRNSNVIENFKDLVGNKNVITNKWGKEPFITGWRYGKGEALAVLKPGTLLEMWQVLKVCVKNDVSIIMQAANTGLTGGSTAMTRKIGLSKSNSRNSGIIDAQLPGKDAW